MSDCRLKYAASFAEISGHFLNPVRDSIQSFLYTLKILNARKYLFRRDLDQFDMAACGIWWPTVNQWAFAGEDGIHYSYHLILILLFVILCSASHNLIGWLLRYRVSAQHVLIESFTNCQGLHFSMHFFPGPSQSLLWCTDSNLDWPPGLHVLSDIWSDAQCPKVSHLKAFQHAFRLLRSAGVHVFETPEDGGSNVSQMCCDCWNI